MPKTILASLCLTCILSLSFSACAWSQSAPTPPPLSPAAIALQQEIADKQAGADVLKQELERTLMIRQAMAKQLESLDTLEKNVGVSMESFPEIVKSLQSKRIDLIIDLAGLTAKREAILLAHEKAKGTQKQLHTQAILDDSLLVTSLDLAEKNARLASVKSLLKDVLPARKELKSADALKIKSQKTLEQEIEITGELNRSSSELKILKKRLQELIN